MENFKQEREVFTFSFKGDNSIDISLLAHTLIGLHAMYSTIVNIQVPDAKIEMKVEAFNKGSFETIVSSFISNVPPIIAMGKEFLPDIKMLMEVIKLKRDLKGNKPKEVKELSNNTKIVNHTGEVHYHNSNVTTLYFNNPIIDKELSNTFTPILNDNMRSSIVLKKSDSEVVIEKEDYENMSRTIIDDLVKDDLVIKENIITTNLLLKSPDLLGNSQWKFLLDKKTISATIEDNVFLEKVKSGQVKTLYAGVKIPVKLKIEVKLNEKLDIVNKKYTVINVIGKIIEPKSNSQIELFDKARDH